MEGSGSPPRTLRDGRYAVLAALGEGAQGTTWDAVDKREGRPVAIKHFDVRGARAWKDVELAEREAKVLASLAHSHLPRYVEHFEEGGELYLVMEKIEGTSLAKLRQKGPMAEADVVRLLRDAEGVLAYLHSRVPPVVHRDLKPSNVIRRPDGSFAFVDFGAVRDRLRPEGGSTVVGTFGYMAPEQFQGRAGPGSDVYAIGATALSLLTGEEPEKLPHRGLAIDVEAALRGVASGKLRSVLAQMLEPDPDRRPTRLAPLLATLGGPAAEKGPGGRARRGSQGADWTAVAELGGKLARGIREQVEREIEESVARASRYEVPRARRGDRAGRRARRRAERAAWRAGRRRGRPPWFVMLALVLALTAAQLAVALAMNVVVPIVLTLLSIVFGRGLREAAHRVSEAGHRAGEAIVRARVAVQGGELPPAAATDEAAAGRTRVEDRDPGRVRVGAESATEDEAWEEEAWEDDSEPRAGPRRTR